MCHPSSFLLAQRAVPDYEGFLLAAALSALPRYPKQRRGTRPLLDQTTANSWLGRTCVETVHPGQGNQPRGQSRGMSTPWVTWAGMHQGRDTSCGTGSSRQCGMNSMRNQRGSQPHLLSPLSASCASGMCTQKNSNYKPSPSHYYFSRGK